MAIISVANVSKCFELQSDRPRSFQEVLVNAFTRRSRRNQADKFWALRNITFDVESGETLGIIGSNGSGKSTCLKLITRILEPSSGKIDVSGRISALLELGAGFHPDLTGRENIYLNGSLLGLSRKEMSSRFEDIVSFAELERFIDMPVKFYSSGMYVRLAFAIAINVNPTVLLVDEVLAVGDQRFQEKCLERIEELKCRGVTIVFISHSLEAVRNLCERAIWLDQGVLREDGPSDLVVARYLQHVHDREEADALVQREHERRDQQLASPPEEEQAAPSQTPTTEPETCDTNLADPMASYRNRWGTREAEIMDVVFLDKEGRERLALVTGRSVTVEIRYRARQRIEHPMFGLAIHRADGLQINGPNNIEASYDIPFIQGTGHVRYMLDVLPLLEGTYYLTAALYNTAGTHAYDHQALYYRFRVHRDAGGERHGAFYIPSRWEHRHIEPEIAASTRRA